MDLRLLDSYAERTRAVDIDDLDWSAVSAQRLPAGVLRALRYMQDTESHTIIYLRELLATRAIDDPAVAEFLACWIFEETAHGRALRRVLQMNGELTGSRPRSQIGFGQRFQEWMIALTSRVWPDFLAVHMTWGAINELTAVQAYNRLAEIADHPVLTELLARIARDESRHFSFYFHQARLRLTRPGVARVVQFLVSRFWSPVGSGVQPASETRFLASFLFSGDEGRAAARKIDQTIRSLPGLGETPVLGAWLDRAGVV